MLGNFLMLFAVTATVGAFAFLDRIKNPPAAQRVRSDDDLPPEAAGHSRDGRG